MPRTTRNQATMDAKRDFTRAIQEHPGLTEAKPCSVPTFTDAIERLRGIHARLEDQVKSLAMLGDCYLGGFPVADGGPAKAHPQADGSVNVLSDQIDGIDDMLSALEGKIDRFRGRH